MFNDDAPNDSYASFADCLMGMCDDIADGIKCQIRHQVQYGLRSSDVRNKPYCFYCCIVREATPMMQVGKYMWWPASCISQLVENCSDPNRPLVHVYHRDGKMATVPDTIQNVLSEYFVEQLPMPSDDDALYLQRCLKVTEIRRDRKW